MAIASSKTIMTTTEAAAITSFPTPIYRKPVPYSQRQLLLHDPRLPYRLHKDREIPELKFGDLLVEVYGIGLNPIDRKSACVLSPQEGSVYYYSLPSGPLTNKLYPRDFGFVLPSPPGLNGREFIGRIIASEVDQKCSLQPGEWVSLLVQMILPRRTRG
jgi:NADPH:quinone reductase-like Zn-dependent oxidoreductase